MLNYLNAQLLERSSPWALQRFFHQTHLSTVCTRQHAYVQCCELGRRRPYWTRHVSCVINAMLPKTAKALARPSATLKRLTCLYWHGSTDMPLLTCLSWHISHDTCLSWHISRGMSVETCQAPLMTYLSWHPRLTYLYWHASPCLYIYHHN